MIKLVILAAIICVAQAGILSSGIGIGHGAVVAAAPVAVAAPVALKTGISYQNGNLLSLQSTPLIAKAPLAIAAPVAVGLKGVSLGLGELGGIGLKGI